MKRFFLSLFAGVFAVSAHAADTRSVEDLNALSNGSVVFTKENDKLVATITDTARVFNITDDVEVDEVRMERVFAADKPATIMLPFSINLNNIKGGSVKRLQGVFDNNTRVDFGEETFGYASAYAPYVVVLNNGSTKLTFEGPVKLLATVENNLKGNPWNDPCANNGNWRMMGTTALKGWTANGVNASEIGYVYGFMGKELSGSEAADAVEGKNEVHVGDFVKVKSAKVNALRGYLKYVGSDDCPVSSNQQQGKPAAPGEESPENVVFSLEDLPDTMVVSVINSNPVVVPVEEESVGGDKIESGTAENGQNEKVEESTTAIHSLKAPTTAKSERWHDASGRSLNKPKSHGVFLQDHTPVLVK
ncbi:hypothetical protein [Fibrobacter sp. UWH6]|uniref:hypothetical protein n=1 Tax=Fibrobacter sp. (strain UWH6) TaxID=1896212 RepID=UPI000911A57A|nr:hypothetical protein [Fibrobacter sp. UWH6]SHL91879.1 hypothetical protein SAMN05720765_14010 [Fibrobacter sp. UWH6]